MHVTAIDRYEIEPGTLTEWTLAPTDELVRSDVPPSYNQQFHLETARTHGVGASVWMAASFDLPAPVNRVALRRTLELIVRRHDALWTGFEVRPDRITRLTVPPHAVAVTPSAAVEFGDTASLRTHLRARFTEVCDPLTFPAFLFATVERAGSSTVLAAFDHTIVDGYSLVIAIRELRQVYELLCATPDIADEDVHVDLDDPGSFMSFCVEESAEEDVDASDPRIRAWARFYESCGGTAPRFPLPLGVQPGKPAPQASDVRSILDTQDTARFEEVCLAGGGAMFSGVLTAIGTALRREGAPALLPLQFPLHTRLDPRWEGSIGWLTTSAPVTVRVDRPDDFAAALADTHSSFRSALNVLGVSMPQVRAGVGDGYRRTSTDLFMVSFIDYRRLAGSEHHRSINAHHISNVTVCDDAQFWVSRTTEGLSIRSRFPDTPVARDTMERFLTRLAEVLTEVCDGRSTLQQPEADLVLVESAV
ncbi:condensation domain-containing protein [Rhodococcus olei]|uniref:Condensation domain-containing protein n=1 Tax=Rhodococcus olei TaxID=2161675 RepID=A0ABP8NVP7_9NOCA